jgi:hypothetical protein
MNWRLAISCSALLFALLPLGQAGADCRSFRFWGLERRDRGVQKCTQSAADNQALAELLKDKYPTLEVRPDNVTAVGCSPKDCAQAWSGAAPDTCLLGGFTDNFTDESGKRWTRVRAWLYDASNQRVDHADGAMSGEATLEWLALRLKSFPQKPEWLDSLNDHPNYDRHALNGLSERPPLSAAV